MKDTLELQKFYPEEIVITEVTQNEKEIYIDIVNIGLHFFLKNVRPYAASCSEA